MPADSRIARFLPAALVYAAITFLSNQSSFPIDEPFPGFDKIVHLLEFAVLGFALAFGFHRRIPLETGAGSRRVRTMPVSWAIGAGLGLLDEAHQMFVSGRNPDPLDAAADALGVGLGIVLFLVIRRRRVRP